MQAKRLVDQDGFSQARTKRGGGSRGGGRGGSWQGGRGAPAPAPQTPEERDAEIEAAYARTFTPERLEAYWNEINGVEDTWLELMRLTFGPAPSYPAEGELSPDGGEASGAAEGSTAGEAGEAGEGVEAASPEGWPPGSPPLGQHKLSRAYRAWETPDGGGDSLDFRLQGLFVSVEAFCYWLKGFREARRDLQDAPNGKGIRLFRAEYMSDREKDPKAFRGGRWTLIIDPKKQDGGPEKVGAIWEAIAFNVVSGRSPREDDLVGCFFVRKSIYYRLGIWTTTLEPKSAECLGAWLLQAIADEVPDLKFELDFQPHNNPDPLAYIIRLSHPAA